MRKFVIVFDKFSDTGIRTQDPRFIKASLCQLS